MVGLTAYIHTHVQLDHGHIMELEATSVASRVLMKGSADIGGAVNTQVGHTVHSHRVLVMLIIYRYHTPGRSCGRW